MKKFNFCYLIAYNFGNNQNFVLILCSTDKYISVEYMTII